MRVRANQDHFCEFMRGIGNGIIPVKETPPLQECVQLDNRCCDDMSLVTAIFPKRPTSRTIYKEDYCYSNKHSEPMH